MFYCNSVIKFGQKELVKIKLWSIYNNYQVYHLKVMKHRITASALVMDI